MVKASASGAVAYRLIRSRVKSMTIKVGFTASLLDAQLSSDNVENKGASLLAVPLGKAHSRIRPSWSGDRCPATPISELVRAH